MITDPALWLQRYGTESAQRRLVCFPHAGGSAAFFRSWSESLLGTEIAAVRYPGRAERIDEPPPCDLVLLARSIADAVEPLADLPLALFGHSMGAVVALETARALEARGIALTHVIASGSRNAEMVAHDDAEAALEDDPDAVMAQLVRLGGTDPELAADPEFRELVLPYVIGDGRMFHAYDMQRDPPLHCPLTTVVGDVDVDADRRPWSELTTETFREHIVPGDHFYLLDDPPYALVRDAYHPIDPKVSIA